MFDSYVCPMSKPNLYFELSNCIFFSITTENNKLRGKINQITVYIPIYNSIYSITIFKLKYTLNNLHY